MKLLIYGRATDGVLRKYILPLSLYSRFIAVLFRMVEMQTLLIEFVEKFEFLPTDATKEIIAGPSAIIAPM